MVNEAGMPRMNQGAHLPWRPRNAPQAAREPRGPAVKKPAPAAMACSKPVAVERTRTLSWLVIGLGVVLVMVITWFSWMIQRLGIHKAWV